MFEHGMQYLLGQNGKEKYRIINGVVEYDDIYKKAVCESSTLVSN